LLDTSIWNKISRLVQGGSQLEIAHEHSRS
jgi:hypothetical protein